MSKKNTDTVTEVRNMIDKYVADREHEIAEIDQHISEAEESKATAEADLQAAIDATIQADYNDAKEAIESAQNVIDMYTERRAQLVNKEFISEAESDAVIDSLLAYKKDCDAALVAALTEECAKIRTIVDKYKEDYKSTFNTIRTWEEEIHPNYRRSGVTYAPGHEPKDPVPVHIPQMHGAVTVCERFLNNVPRTY